MDSSPPAKRKKITVEHMEIDSPRVTRSSSPRPRSPLISSLHPPRVSSPRHLHPYRVSSPRPRSPRISTPPRSPLRHHSPSPLIPSVSSPQTSSSPWEETEGMEDGASSVHSPTHKRKVGGGESKHNLVARVKKTLNEKLHNIKPVLLAWLQKYLGDPRLSGILNLVTIINF
jgi:hypothetical protein